MKCSFMECLQKFEWDQTFTFRYVYKNTQLLEDLEFLKDPLLYSWFNNFLHGITLLFSTSQCIDHFLLKNAVRTNEAKWPGLLIDWKRKRQLMLPTFDGWKQKKSHFDLLHHKEKWYLHSGDEKYGEIGD